MFFLLKSIERFHCIGAGVATGLGVMIGLGVTGLCICDIGLGICGFACCCGTLCTGCCCGLGLVILLNSGKIFVLGERYVNGKKIQYFEVAHTHGIVLANVYLFSLDF